MAPRRRCLEWRVSFSTPTRHDEDTEPGECATAVTIIWCLADRDAVDGRRPRRHPEATDIGGGAGLKATDIGSGGLKATDIGGVRLLHVKRS